MQLRTSRRVRARRARVRAGVWAWCVGECGGGSAWQGQPGRRRGRAASEQQRRLGVGVVVVRSPLVAARAPLRTPRPPASLRHAHPLFIAQIGVHLHSRRAVLRNLSHHHRDPLSLLSSLPLSACTRCGHRHRATVDNSWHQCALQRRLVSLGKTRKGPLTSASRRLVHSRISARRSLLREALAACRSRSHFDEGALSCRMLVL